MNALHAHLGGASQDQTERHRSPTETTYSIAELAREFGITHRTIRFYEDQGLLAPAREGQRRIFDQRDRTRLRLALRGRRLGFPLGEVREIIDLYDAPAGEGRQLDLLLSKIAARRAELEAKRRDIEAAIADLEGVARACRRRRRELAGSRVRRKST